MPDLLIISPIFREVSRISRLVDCLQGQTFQSWVVFFHDNNSNDGSIELLSEFSKTDSRVMFGMSEQTTNFGRNWNSAVAKSSTTGQYKFVMFLSGDDYLEPKDALEKMVFLAGSAPGPKVVVPKFVGRNHQLSSDVPIFALGNVTPSKFGRALKIVNPGIGHLVYSFFPADIFNYYFLARRFDFEAGTDTDWFFATELLMSRGQELIYEESVIYVKDQRPEPAQRWLQRQMGKANEAEANRGVIIRKARLLLSDLFWPPVALFRLIRRPKFDSRAWVFFVSIPMIQLRLVLKAFLRLIRRP
jgi:glycosyltransferase involved in cell wall biosynthesis